MAKKKRVRNYKLEKASTRLNKEIKRITDLENTLRVLVHSPNCERDVSECPQNHSKCRRRLNFKTATLWGIADTLGYTVTIVKEYQSTRAGNPDRWFWFDSKPIHQKLAKYQDRIQTLHHVLRSHYNKLTEPEKKVYPKLATGIHLLQAAVTNHNSLFGNKLYS